jgi:hypothetical protein
LMNLASGTGLNPQAWAMPMVMKRAGSWNTMFMGSAFLVDTQQSGPRGGDKLYSANWMMASLEHKVGSRGFFQGDLMLSLEPASVTNRSYPLLFQTGETAYGRPLVDAQHPHDFIMGLGFHYTYQLGEDTFVDTYFAPVGDPALGPVAFPHRASAAELPQAPISHHLQDSTHIANEVVTVGIQHKWIKLEASGFHGTEPNENRWNIDAGAIDSWSGRLWILPSRNWVAQVSLGRIAHPEELEPGDQVRVTASVHYTNGGWSSSLIWGRTHSTASQHNNNAYLFESVLPIRKKNFLTGRIELADKDELFQDGGDFHIGAYTIGYTRDLDWFPRIETGVGVNFSVYSVPDAIKPDYGNHPAGANIFVRFRLRPPA